MNIGNAIYTILKAASAVTSIIGTGDDCKAYPVVVAQGKSLPFVTWQVISSEPNATKDGPSTLDYYRVQVNCLTEYPKTDQCHTLASAVRTALDRVAPATYGGVQVHEANYKSTNDSFNYNSRESGAIAVSMDFVIAVFTS